jgi:hypothetical protein
MFKTVKIEHKKLITNILKNLAILVNLACNLPILCIKNLT